VGSSTRWWLCKEGNALAICWSCLRLTYSIGLVIEIETPPSIRCFTALFVTTSRRCLLLNQVYFPSILERYNDQNHEYLCHFTGNGLRASCTYASLIMHGPQCCRVMFGTLTFVADRSSSHSVSRKTVPPCNNNYTQPKKQFCCVIAIDYLLPMTFSIVAQFK
jgi:hypothetical protein